MKRIDLLPEEAKAFTAKMWLKRYLLRYRAFRIIAGVFLVLVAINLWQASAIIRYRIYIARGEKKMIKLEARLRHLQGQAVKIDGEREAVRGEIAYVEKRLGVLARSKKERYLWAGVLAYLSRLVPKELWIKRLELTPELTTIDGTTFNNAIVSDFMARLDESDYFRKTSFNFTEKSRLTDKSVVDFEITTHLVREKVRKGLSDSSFE